MGAPITIPAAIIAFLLNLGCDPTREVYLVNEIDLKLNGRSLVGLYCPFKEEPYCPAPHTVYILSSNTDRGVLVHELWHSCQKPAAYGTREWSMNEKEADALEYYWRGKQ